MVAFRIRIRRSGRGLFFLSSFGFVVVLVVVILVDAIWRCRPTQEPNDLKHSQQKTHSRTNFIL